MLNFALFNVCLQILFGDLLARVRKKLVGIKIFVSKQDKVVNLQAW